jgi:hypothetical protein
MEVVKVIPEEGIMVDKFDELMSNVSYAFDNINATMEAMQGYYKSKGIWTVSERQEFSSSRKFSAVSFLEHGTYYVGAPEFVLRDDFDKYKDVVDKLTYMVSQCAKIYYGNVPGSYRDILAADRIALIFKIREITFLDGMSSIKLPVPANACETAGCKPQDTVIFNSSKLKFTPSAPELEKYYDSINKCYNIRTKSFGTITLYPPSIGVNTIISNWLVEQSKEEKKVDAALTEILQYLIGNWRKLNNNSIFNILGELSTWSTEKFTLVFRLVEKLNIGIEFEIKERCETCGGEITVPITFPDGYKSLFIPTVSDFGDELL